MPGIPYLAAHRDKRAGKEECFNVIRRMAAGEAATDADLASLYSYFLPPKAKKITDPFHFAAAICDDKANFAFCKYVESKAGCLLSATTNTCHIVFTDKGLAPGFYDVGGGFAGDDVAIMPDCFGVMSEASRDGAYEGFSLDDLAVSDTPSGLVYVMPWNGKGVRKEYLDMVFQAIDGPAVSRNNNGAMLVTGTVRGVYVCAVTMPGDFKQI